MCEAWTITEKKETQIKSFENKSHRRLLGITYREHKTNIYIKENNNSYVGKLRHCCQLSKKESCVGLAMYHLTILSLKVFTQDNIEDARPHGRPQMEWMDNIYKWTSKDLGDLLMMTKD